MGLGNLVKDVLTVGGTARRRNRAAKKEEQQADDMIRANTELAQQMFDRDLGSSRFEGMDVGVRADPAMLDAQRQSLGRMQDSAREGYTDVDRQAMQAQLQDVARYEQAQRQSLVADAQARGVSGSGLDIMSQLAAQQAGADRAMQTGADMAVAGRDRAYQANADAGAMAGQMRSQGFGEDQQNVANRMTQAGAIDNYGQWRIGQQGNDAAMLMNARGGNAQMLNDRATQKREAFNEGIDQAVQVGGAIANAYTGGASGAVTNAVGAPGAKSLSGPGSAAAAGPAGPAAAGAPQAKGRMMPSGTVPGAPQATGAPAPQATRPANLGGAIANAYGAAPAAPRFSGVMNNARRRGALLLGGTRA